MYHYFLNYIWVSYFSLLLSVTCLMMSRILNIITFQRTIIKHPRVQLENLVVNNNECSVE